MSKVEKKELRITNVDVDIHDYFCDTAKNLNLDKKQLFDLLLNTYQFFNFKLSEEEKDTLKYINNTVPDIFQRKIKQVIEKLGNKLKNTDYEDVDLSIKNSSKSAFLRIEKIIDDLVKQNDNGKEWFDRRYINQKTIFEFAKENKRLTPDFLAVSNRSIKQYLAINKIKINEYNNKYDMKEDHNLKVHYFKLKQSKV